MTVHTEDGTQTVTHTLAGVRFFEIGKLYHFSCEHLPGLMVGDQVIVETTRGRQLGQVMNLLTPDDDPDREYKPILRKVTPPDLMSQQLWQAREIEALITCREKAATLDGFKNAKFVAAQYNYDGSLLTFLFNAEEKLNTGKLRSTLQRSFKAKIDLRQIGPRDVAKIIGGMGACGIPRCCSTFLTDFSPISIKMAKAQGISLNPSEITGMCGRLRCCLIYEFEQYVEARKHLPKRNKRIGTPHGEGKVIDVHPLQDAVTVYVEDKRHLVTREEIIPLEEWEALKAKAAAGCSKHEDGACDCGSPRPPHKPKPAVSRQSTVKTDEAPAEAQAQGQSDTQEQQSKRNKGRRRRGGRSRRGRRTRGKDKNTTPKDKPKTNE
ncbi:MAG: hypothetical protein K8S97_09010 [Anaerolineae bacterium]|nr:hypothetical protein [Anaerolineae bacterium]